ncbi:MAG: helix-turn-helix domain-containing protein, partial [Vicinamibacterales bacterium]
MPVVAPRDRLWRRDAHIAIDQALQAGELSLHEAAVLRAVLAFSDDTGQVIFAGQQTIAQAAGWESDRTVRRWLRAAEARGWVAVEHRCLRHPDGRVQQMTNLTVVVLPVAVEARRQARKAAGYGKGRATPRAPQNRSQEAEGDRRPTPPMRTPVDAVAV